VPLTVNTHTPRGWSRKGKGDGDKGVIENALAWTGIKKRLNVRGICDGFERCPTIRATYPNESHEQAV
jgi:hypothetical protein